MKRIAPIEQGAPQLWPFVQELIKDCLPWLRDQDGVIIAFPSLIKYTPIYSLFPVPC